MLKTLVQPERAVKVVKSIAGHGYTFNEGESVDHSCRRRDAAAILEQNSEPFSGSLHDATRFDPEEWERATRPRSAPPPVRELDEDGICKKFEWSREQLAVAKANGFPARTGRVRHRAEQVGRARRGQLGRAIRSLNLR